MSITRRKIVKIGKILHKSPIAKNIAIGDVKQYIEEGTIVYDKNAEKLGVILEIFGPVTDPYVRIKLEKDDFEKGSDIFIIEGEKKKITWRKKPREGKTPFKKGRKS